jgi:multidrug efflux pump subunit AcrB
VYRQNAKDRHATKDTEMGIVHFALRYPYTFYVLAAFIVLLGVSAITVMPRDIFPINIPVVSVIWQYTAP